MSNGEIDIDDILRGLKKKFEEDDCGIELANGMNGSDVSDTVKSQQKAEYEADEQKKPRVEKKDQDDGPKIIKSKDGRSAIVACKSPEEAMEAIKKYGMPDGILTLGDLLDRILQGGADYGLTKEEDKHLEDLLKPLQEFCDKHGLPAMTLVQHYKQGKSIGMKGFRNVEEERMEIRMRFMMRLKDIIYNDECSAEDLEEIAEVLNSVHSKQEKRK